MENSVGELRGRSPRPWRPAVRLLLGAVEVGAPLPLPHGLLPAGPRRSLLLGPLAVLAFPWEAALKVRHRALRRGVRAELPRRGQREEPRPGGRPLRQVVALGARGHGPEGPGLAGGFEERRRRRGAQRQQAPGGPRSSRPRALVRVEEAVYVRVAVREGVPLLLPGFRGHLEPGRELRRLLHEQQDALVEVLLHLLDGQVVRVLAEGLVDLQRYVEEGPEGGHDEEAHERAPPPRGDGGGGDHGRHDPVDDQHAGDHLGVGEGEGDG
mmetsp:Transcript_84065/g.272059  ORF Transcript_84065/g.272059 Transcript_84065/m.272059 type:complete len:268 (+) Transcript_84065:415-1218(+)